MSPNILFLIGLSLLGAVVLWSFWYDWKVTREMPPAGRRISTPFGRVHVIEQGPGEPGRKPPADQIQRPVVLIHGSTTNALDMTLALMPGLAPKRRVIAPDRAGHGFSDRPPDGWRLDTQAAAIRALLDELGIERPIIMGQSFGSAVALRYALDFPDEVAGLVLVAPVSHPWLGGVAWYNRVGINPAYGWLFRHSFIALYGRFGSPRGVLKALRGSPYQGAYHTRTRVPLTFRPSTFRHNAEDIVRLYEQLVALARRYGEIDCPVEIVAGTHDMTVLTTIHARGLERQIRGAKLQVIDDSGHALHHTHPDAVLAAIDRLEARLASEERSPLQGALRRLSAAFPRSHERAPHRRRHEKDVRS